MPLRPAFCHIIELMATSASTSVAWNHRAPSTHETPRYSTRKLAQSMRTDWCIHLVRVRVWLRVRVRVRVRVSVRVRVRVSVRVRVRVRVG